MELYLVMETDRGPFRSSEFSLISISQPRQGAFSRVTWPSARWEKADTGHRFMGFVWNSQTYLCWLLSLLVLLVFAERLLKIEATCGKENCKIEKTRHLFTVVYQRAGQANRLKSRLHPPLMVPTLPVEILRNCTPTRAQTSRLCPAFVCLLLLLMVTLQLQLIHGWFLPLKATHQSDIPHVLCSLQWLSRGRWRCMELGSGGVPTGLWVLQLVFTYTLNVCHLSTTTGSWPLPFLWAGSHSPSRV